MSVSNALQLTCSGTGSPPVDAQAAGAGHLSVGSAGNSVRKSVSSAVTRGRNVRAACSFRSVAAHTGTTL